MMARLARQKMPDFFQTGSGENGKEIFEFFPAVAFPKGPRFCPSVILSGLCEHHRYKGEKLFVISFV